MQNNIKTKINNFLLTLLLVSLLLILTPSNASTDLCSTKATGSDYNFLLDEIYLRCNYEIYTNIQLENSEFAYPGYTTNNSYRIVDTTNNQEITEDSILKGKEIQSGQYKGTILPSCVAGFKILNTWVACTKSPRNIDTMIIPKTPFVVGSEFEMDINIGFGSDVTPIQFFQAGPDINFGNFSLFMSNKLDVQTFTGLSDFNCKLNMFTIVCLPKDPTFKRYNNKVITLNVKGTVNPTLDPLTNNEVVACVFYTNYSGQDCNRFQPNFINNTPNPNLDLEVTQDTVITDNQESHIYVELKNNSTTDYNGPVELKSSIPSPSFITWVDTPDGIYCNYSDTLNLNCNNWKSINIKPGQSIKFQIKIWFRNLNNTTWSTNICTITLNNNQCQETIIKPTTNETNSIEFTELNLNIQKHDLSNQTLTYIISNPSTTKPYIGNLFLKNNLIKKNNISNISSNIPNNCDWIQPKKCKQNPITIPQGKQLEIIITYKTPLKPLNNSNKVCIENSSDEQICKTKKLTKLQ